MTLGELIKSIHNLENYLSRFEEKYQLRSDDFYQLVTEDKLEQSNDFIEWLGVYKIKQKREKKYRELLAEILPQKEELNLPLSQ